MSALSRNVNLSQLANFITSPHFSPRVLYIPFVLLNSISLIERNLELRVCNDQARVPRLNSSISVETVIKSCRQVPLISEKVTFAAFHTSTINSVEKRGIVDHSRRRLHAPSFVHSLVSSGILVIPSFETELIFSIASLAYSSASPSPVMQLKYTY